MKKAAIFDLDGTLLYTLEDLADSTNYALSCFGYSPCSVSQVRSYVGNGVRLLIARALPQGEANPVFEECLSTFKNHYKKNMYNKTKPYDGVIEMLDKLKALGIKTAVVSNKFDTATKELCAHYFKDRIDISIGESSSIRKKPAPDSVLEVIKIFGADKNDCVYIGDSEVDIQTAQNAGIDCISVNWGYKDTDFLISNGASCIVENCEELLKSITT